MPKELLSFEKPFGQCVGPFLVSREGHRQNGLLLGCHIGNRFAGDPNA
jgi:hypothetical protein